ncbi:diguanylate cyclase [Marinicella sediminis]|uniref:diguanylate cyclase n=1 Tax=Marinicella sediminis TaxID=1792834 RepID=A0ABV7JCH0_9GAMM|nr:diguanylate cyclase [Marinicella sediminis]
MTQNTIHYLSWIDVDNELHSVRLLAGQRYVIGRSDQADVEVLNTSVSRQHLELFWQQGALLIRDLRSSYGTWADNQRVERDDTPILHADTELKLGNLSMWYERRLDNESQEMFQTCFHPPTKDDEVELSSEFNDFRRKLLFLLQDNFGDNTLNIKLIRKIDDELHELINAQELRLKEQRILNSISHILNRSLTLKELLKTSLNLVSKVLNAERGFVVVKDPGNELMEIPAVRHFEDFEWHSQPAEPRAFSQKLVQKCFRQNKILIIGDSMLNDSMDDLAPTEDGGGRSVVVIPLVQDTQVIGVIYLDNQQQAHNFNPQQIPFLTTFAAHTSIALHNSLLYKRAITDDLTQLFTRQHIDEALALEMQRAIRYEHDLSLLILDLDHFKSINDSHGHTTGDQVLKAFSEIIRAHIRECDMAGRFGGEEFIVILAETDIKGAFILAERIRHATEQLRIDKSGESISLTVSIGAASAHVSQDNNTVLFIEAADKALYQAKEQGRNQTVCA